MFDLNHYQLLPVFLISSVLILAGSEIGLRLGVRARSQGGGNVTTLEGAMLGLLALMIGFTFAMALSRFEARRDAVLSEANAIGTTALRARLLPAPESGEVLKLLREYVQIRVNITRKVPSQTELGVAIARSNAIHEALWQQAKAASAKDSEMVPTGLFIQTLNEMIDTQEKRLTAMRNRVPDIVLIALYSIAIIASSLTGYAGGLEAAYSRLPVYVVGMLVSAIILLIQDLDRPGTGFIEVSQQPMIDTAASLATYAD